MRKVSIHLSQSFKAILVILVLVSFHLGVQAQDPGGVSGATFWFTPRSAENSDNDLPEMDGESVHFWRNLTGNGDAYGNVVGDFPKYQTEQTINGFGALRFNGLDEYLPIDYEVDPSDADMNAVTIFAIVKPAIDPLGTDAYIMSGDRSDYWAFMLNDRNKIQLDAGGRNGGSVSITDVEGTKLTTESFQLATADAEFQNTGGSYELFLNAYYNGKLPENANSTNYSQDYFGGSDKRIFNIGVGSEGEEFPPDASELNRPNYFNGDIAEIIVYLDKKCTTEEKIQVWTYLALKYSITLETRDYLASDGITKVCDRDSLNDEPYHHNVIGIFDQYSATPMSNLKHQASADKDSMIIINDDLADMYLIVGDNEDDYEVVEGTYGSATFATNKIWKYQLTDVSNCVICPPNETITSVELDISSLIDAPTGKAGNFFLLIDADDSFASIDDAVQATSLADNKVTFEDVSLPVGTGYLRLGYMIDTDSDGIGNAEDDDDDNDGISDSDELLGTNDDPDGDGITNDLDLDSDGDGIPDLLEGNSTIRSLETNVVDGFLDATELSDSNMNGMHESAEGTSQHDTDGDLIPDYLDLDSDNDGISDLIEGRNFYHLDSEDDGTESGTDIDQDGLYDSFDEDTSTFGNGLEIALTDSNTDGIFNFQTETSNAGFDNAGADFVDDHVADGLIADQTDNDGDGIADVVDDKPGVFGGLSGRSSDWDGDGVNNSLDGDVDNDGILNTTELALGADTDTDGDGAVDSRDLDSDNDGIFDIIEAGDVSVLAEDSNGDGMVDIVDPISGSRPGVNPNVSLIGAVAESTLDGDVIPDYLDLDSDGDGLSDAMERGNKFGYRFHPGKTDRGYFNQNDVDRDGISDAIDIDTVAKGSSYLTPNSDYLNTDNTIREALDFSTESSTDLDQDGIDDGIDGNDDKWGELAPYETFAPAGIYNGLQLWIRASDSFNDLNGQIIASDGDEVIYVRDTSRNKRDGKQELNIDAYIEPPILIEDAMNYNKALSFDGLDDQIPLDLAFDYANDTMSSIFINMVIQVPQTFVNTDEKIIFSMDRGTFFRCSIIQEGGKWLVEWNTNSPGESTADMFSSTEMNDGKPHLISFAYELSYDAGMPSVGVKSLYVDGKMEASTNEHFERLGELNATRFANLGSGSKADEFGGEVRPNDPFEGYISEITIHQNLTEDQRNKLFSYLAIKYGATLSTDGNGYYTQAGNQIWSTSGDDFDYMNTVIGLGRNDLTEFNQSKSGNDTLTFWTVDGMEVEQDISDGHYYLIGRNQGDPDVGITDDVPSSDDYVVRSSRVYRFRAIDNSEGINDFMIKMKVRNVETALVGSTATDTELTNNLALLISDDETFADASVLDEPDADSEGVSFKISGDILDGWYFTLASKHANPLPLDWVSIAGKRKENNVQLKWQTVNEINVSHFEVERSINTVDFEIIGTETAFNSSGPNFYSFKDEEQIQSAFYRVRQVDFDGASEYSETIRVDGVEETKLIVFPNPTEDKVIHFEINLMPNEEVKVMLRDTSGKVLQSFTSSSENGHIRHDLKCDKAGIYILKVQVKGKAWTSKVVVN